MNKIIFLGFFLSLTACGVDKCSEDSEAVMLARSFSSDEYAAMFRAMEDLKKTAPAFPIFPERDNIDLAKEIKALRPKKISIQRRSPGVNLEGCFDHYVIMYFKGLNSKSGSITLTWGEGPEAGSQELWRR